jgi:hypothetical protein
MVNSHCYKLLAGHLGWSPAAGWQRWLTGVLDRDLFGTRKPARRTPRSGSSTQ